MLNEWMVTMPFSDLIYKSQRILRVHPRNNIKEGTDNTFEKCNNSQGKCNGRMSYNQIKY